MRSLLIRCLGGVPDSEYQKLASELKEKQDEVDGYKLFAKSIYVYAGNYQAEFRQLMNDCNCPVSDEPFNFSNKNYIDSYLGRIVDGLQRLIHKQKMISNFNAESWDLEALEHVRGKQYLDKNSNMNIKSNLYLKTD